MPIVGEFGGEHLKIYFIQEKEWVGISSGLLDLKAAHIVADLYTLAISAKKITNKTLDILLPIIYL